MPGVRGVAAMDVTRAGLELAVERLRRHVGTLWLLYRDARRDLDKASLALRLARDAEEAGHDGISRDPELSQL